MFYTHLACYTHWLLSILRHPGASFCSKRRARLKPKSPDPSTTTTIHKNYQSGSPASFNCFKVKATLCILSKKSTAFKARQKPGILVQTPCMESTWRFIVDRNQPLVFQPLKCIYGNTLYMEKPDAHSHIDLLGLDRYFYFSFLMSTRFMTRHYFG